MVRKKQKWPGIWNTKRTCPICDKAAISEHHIKPVHDGGMNCRKNVTWLCKDCHDKVEGRPLTSQLIRRLRVEGFGNCESSEVLWWIGREDGDFLLGIKRPGKPLIEIGVLLPPGTAI